MYRVYIYGSQKLINHHIIVIRTRSWVIWVKTIDLLTGNTWRQRPANSRAVRWRYLPRLISGKVTERCLIMTERRRCVRIISYTSIVYVYKIIMFKTPVEEIAPLMKPRWGGEHGVPI